MRPTNGIVTFSWDCQFLDAFVKPVTQSACVIAAEKILPALNEALALGEGQGNGERVVIRSRD
jgi:hypothetical protein